MREVVVCAAVRSAVGKSGRGSLKDTRPDELLGQVMAGVLARLPGLDPKRIDDVVIGTAMPEAEQGMNVARIGSFIAGTVATLVIAVAAPPLAEVALKFGPAEYFSLMVLGLVAAVVLAHGSLL